MRMRPFLRAWHRWFGILCGVWLMLLAATGSALAWYDEIDAALNPELRLVEPGSVPPVPLDRVLTNAETALPGFSVGYFLLAPSPDASHWLVGRQVAPSGEVHPVQVFADPSDGRILGWRQSDALVLDRKHLPDLIYGLHTELLLHEAGLLIVGFIGLAWMLDHLMSVPLAIPRMREWRAAFAIGGRPGSLRRLWDWHRAKGMWLWPLTFMLALTGVTLTFQAESRDVVRLFSPVGERLHDSMEARAPVLDRIGIDGALAATGAGLDEVHSVRPFPGVGVYAVRRHDPRDLDGLGRLWTYVRMDDGTVHAQRHDNGESAGDMFFAWQYPLHSGRIGGIGGRIVVSLAGLVTMALCFTGLWLVVRRGRRQRRYAGRAVGPDSR